MAAPKTAGEFVQVLEQSQLIAPVHLGKIRAKIPPPNNPGFDAATFANATVKEGLLTPYHVRKLMSGQPEGFFVGKFRLLDVLGQGGMGKVYLAEQMTMKRAVALKLVRFAEHDDDSLLVRFIREARAAAKLRHQNITQAYDFDQAGPYHYIAMEFIEGINLQDWVEKTGRIPWALAASYVAQAAHGLQHASQHGLVHRDIKPGNLMVEMSGMLKILDLGLVVLPSEVDSLTRGQRDLILGTADYMSPEQAMDSHQVDIRADIYSLGAVFFFMLTGRPPFLGKSAAAKIIAHQTIQPQPIGEIIPDMPKKLAEILHRMLAKNPDDRFSKPVDVADALKPFAQLATKASPPYDPALVRFTRSRVEKLVLFGADSPPAQLTTDTRLLASQSDIHISGDIATPNPGDFLTSADPPLGQAKPITPRTIAQRRSNLIRQPLGGKPAGTPLPKTNGKLKLTPPSPGRKAGGSKANVAQAEILEVMPEPESDMPRASRKRMSKLRWLIFMIPNIVAILFILYWVLYLR